MKAFTPITRNSGDISAALPSSMMPPQSAQRFSLGERHSSAGYELDNGFHGQTQPSTTHSLSGTDLSHGESTGLYLMPVSSSTILLTLNQLAVMSQNGVEIAEAVGHVSNHCQDPRLAASLNAIHSAVSGGSTFSSAVSMHGKYFPPALPAMIAAAEATGDVPQTLGNVCERMRGEIEMRSSIVGAMIYPCILIAAASIVMTALVLGVLPQFGRVFESMGKPVPPLTQFLLDVGTFGRAYWIYLIPGVLATLAFLFTLRRHPMVQVPIGRFMLYAPVLREAYRPLIAGRNFRTVAAMVRGGVPLLQAVRLTRNTVRDRSWHELLGRVEANLIDGRRASEAFQGVDFLPVEATQMMVTGERTGRIPEVLEDIGRFYEQEGGRKLKRLVVAVEPLIILVMGVVVAGVVMSVMLPLLDISTIQH